MAHESCVFVAPGAFIAVDHSGGAPPRSDRNDPILVRPAHRLGHRNRYFLASVFAVTALAFATAKKGGVIGWTSMVVAGSAFLLAMPTDAVEGARPGLHWARSASRFDAAAVGTPVSFGLYQSSEMVLVKRAGESVIPLACSKTVKAASVGLASPLDATAVGTHLTGGSTSRRGHCRF